ncbi:conserved hypothetical protein [Gloeothece citriformis PCC 7424]|uniref:Uncharacterized protein n=1 Tax=Gloeothece citriformis (strain PCC 7424) TaxID=65393 RepID=B7KBW8_GLOC7|nr:hypothetical protein [Gloeothece citriformis]ACK68791.1 conserved hypothetical protein [Gloeothece citriformis PCC 7424]
MSGQLCWLPKFQSNGDLILHIRLESYQSWKPYTAFPMLKVPDYPIPGGSKGWATYQKLLKSGWTLIPTEQAKKGLVNHSALSVKN